jgi:hypothetical protein
VRRLDPEVVRRWVEEWCAAQGVAVKVAEAGAVERVAALLRGGASASPARRTSTRPARTVTRSPSTHLPMFGTSPGWDLHPSSPPIPRSPRGGLTCLPAPAQRRQIGSNLPGSNL